MDGKQRRHSILVVGSANMDMVVSCDRFPKPGETILAGDFVMNPGGKGANQAVACARLGGSVAFLGKTGKDVFADKLQQSLSADGVALNHLLVAPESPTGIAIIAVDGHGENQIMVVSGSNMALTPADIEREHAALEEADIVLMQLEIPLETVETVAALAHRHGKQVILNPAPARHLPAALLQRIDYLTPNETETSILTGMPVADLTTAERAGKKLLEWGVRHVIITLGPQGALLVTKDEATHFPAAQVRAVDTTAAGDAFNGALALALAEGRDLHDAIRYAGAAGTLAVTKKGAQSAMPTPNEVKELLAKGDGILESTRLLS